MRLIDADAFSELVGEPIEVFLSRLDLKLPPTIDAEPVRHGKWLWLDGVRCSECNYKLETTGLPSYCPNCGARMDAE